MISDINEGGTFLLNCGWTLDELEEKLPGQMKRAIAEKKINFYTIDGVKIAKEIGLGGRINTILQSAFFKLANIIPADDAIKYMKDAATASYGKKGEHIVKMNHDAIDRGAQDVVKVDYPASWANAQDTDLTVKAEGGREDVLKYVNTIQNPINAFEGSKLPVSAFKDYVNGVLPLGSSAYEKRGIAIDVPNWNPENCIQCNFCSYVCPHAVIRPVAMTDEELKNAPEGTLSLLR